MSNFDYAFEAELFDADTESELSFVGDRERRPIGYKRFARAADAIQFAIEELERWQLAQVCLRVDEQRFDAAGIRRLYDSAGYPLVRRPLI